MKNNNRERMMNGEIHQMVKSTIMMNNMMTYFKREKIFNVFLI